MLHANRGKEQNLEATINNYLKFATKFRFKCPMPKMCVLYLADTQFARY